MAPKDEYQGPGKFTAAVGRGLTEQTIVGTGVGAVTIPLAYAGKLSRGGALAASTLSLGALAHGAYKGWTNAGKAEQDFHQQHERVALLEQENTGLKSVVGAFTHREQERTAQQDSGPQRG